MRHGGIGVRRKRDERKEDTTPGKVEDGCMVVTW
jgi:hypothetical protein